MRGVLFGVALSLVAHSAYAADPSGPYLRGSSYEAIPAAKWGGWYAGLHAGASVATGDFATATSSMIALILNNTLLENEGKFSTMSTLGRQSAGSISYGAFVGYNTVWEDAVLGVEFTYNRTNNRMGSANALGRSFETSDEYLHDVNLQSAAGIKLTDFATARLRGGWAFGDWLPYMVAGVAVGRGDVTRSATVAAVGVDNSGTIPPAANQVIPPTTQSENRKAAFGYGYVLGVGFDYEIARDVFVRGEYEFVHFPTFRNIDVLINTARIAAGVRF